MNTTEVLSETNPGNTDRVAELTREYSLSFPLRKRIILIISIIFGELNR